MALLLAARGQGIMNHELLKLLEIIPRRSFLNAGRHIQAKLMPERSMPIACGQIQTAPITVARIIHALDINQQHKILEIGTGSGYQAALLSRLCRKLYTIERFRTLLEEATLRFEKLKFNNIVTRLADGETGWSEQEGFDRIVVNVALGTLPTMLLDQLKPNGILIAPILQTDGASDIVIHIKREGELVVRELTSGRFLPLIPGVAMYL